MEILDGKQYDMCSQTFRNSFIATRQKAAKNNPCVVEGNELSGTRSLKAGRACETASATQVSDYQAGGSPAAA
jgi:hypothetical protein